MTKNFLDAYISQQDLFKNIFVDVELNEVAKLNKKNFEKLWVISNCNERKEQIMGLNKWLKEFYTNHSNFNNIDKVASPPPPLILAHHLLLLITSQNVLIFVDHESLIKAILVIELNWIMLLLLLASDVLWSSSNLKLRENQYEKFTWSSCLGHLLLQEDSYKVNIII